MRDHVSPMRGIMYSICLQYTLQSWGCLIHNTSPEFLLLLILLSLPFTIQSSLYLSAQLHLYTLFNTILSIGPF